MVLNVGGPEVMVIALIALIFIGPEELPGILRRVGKQVSQIRSMTNSVRDEFMAGIDEINPSGWLDDDVLPNAKADSSNDDGPSQQELIEGLEASELAAEQAALGAAESEAQAQKFRAKADAARHERQQAAARSKESAEPDDESAITSDAEIAANQVSDEAFPARNAAAEYHSDDPDIDVQDGGGQ